MKEFYKLTEEQVTTLRHAMDELYPLGEYIFKNYNSDEKIISLLTNTFNCIDPVIKSLFEQQDQEKFRLFNEAIEIKNKNGFIQTDWKFELVQNFNDKSCVPENSKLITREFVPFVPYAETVVKGSSWIELWRSVEDLLNQIRSSENLDEKSALQIVGFFKVENQDNTYGVELIPNVKNLKF